MTEAAARPATDRQIYEWKDDAGKQRRSDPMVLSRRFHEALRKSDVDYSRIRADIAVGAVALELQESTEKDRMENIYHGLESKGKLAEIAYHVFQVRPLDDDGGGWTESEAFDALMAYFAWEGSLMGELESSPSTPKPSDSPGCPSNSPTESGTASISIPNG